MDEKGYIHETKTAKSKDETAKEAKMIQLAARPDSGKKPPLTGQPYGVEKELKIKRKAKNWSKYAQMYTQ